VGKRKQTIFKKRSFDITRQNVFGKEELLVMAKFETRGQIAGLFLAAGAVALLLILLLTAEVQSFLK
jgi:hypothetical protein